jgi:SnoaL-like domain
MLDKPRPVVVDSQRLLDKEAIRETMCRYARGVDRRDYDLVRSVYHPDAFDDHGTYKGGVDGLIEWIARRHATIEQSMHTLCNSTIEFLSDDVAVSETYLITTQRYPAEAKETIQAWVGDMKVGANERLSVTMYARMIDRFERRAGEWKVAKRTVIIERTDSKLVPVREAAPISVEHVRGPGDALYEFLRG